MTKGGGYMQVSNQHSSSKNLLNNSNSVIDRNSLNDMLLKNKQFMNNFIVQQKHQVP